MVKILEYLLVTEEVEGSIPSKVLILKICLFVLLLHCFFFSVSVRSEKAQVVLNNYGLYGLFFIFWNRFSYNSFNI